MRLDSHELFERVKEHFASDPKVSGARMFGSEGLKIGGKVFAMLVKENLVIKLPAKRCAEILAAPGSQVFDPGHGRLMKEWVQVSMIGMDWIALAAEARKYVGSHAD